MGIWLMGKLGCAWVGAWVHGVVVISWSVGGVFKLYVRRHCVEAARRREEIKECLIELTNLTP